MTTQRLREEGTYIGFCYIRGYMYKIAGSVYAYNAKGLVKVFPVK